MKFSPDPLALMHHLIYHHDWDATLKHLKVYPCDATAKDAFRRLPLHIAALSEAPFEVFKALFRIEPNSVNAKDKWGDLPLHLYLEDCRNQSLEIFQLLKNDDAVRTANSDGKLPLHAACKNKYLKLGVLQLLLDDCPEAVGKVDKSGWTPLHYACTCWTSKQSELFNELLHRKQYSTTAALMEHERGECALDFACKNSKFSNEMIQQLVEVKHAALEIGDKQGERPNKKNNDSKMQKMNVIVA